MSDSQQIETVESEVVTNKDADEKSSEEGKKEEKGASSTEDSKEDRSKVKRPQANSTTKEVAFSLPGGRKK